MRIDKPLTTTALSLISIVLLSTCSFSKPTQRKILKRARHRSEWSGVRNMPLEASHRNHREDNNYDCPENGEALTMLEHLAFHIYWSANPRLIGLDKPGNNWAIDQLKTRVIRFLKDSGVTNPEAQCKLLVDEVIDRYWERMEEAVFTEG